MIQVKSNRSMIRRWGLAVGAGLFAMLLFALPSAFAATQETYDWENAAIGGGGYVTGMAIHPTEPDLVYIRTDVGGAYRWDPDNRRWIQLLNGLKDTEWNMYGVDAIALDPSDPDVVYAAVGKYNYSASDILKSTDRGETWTRTGFAPKSESNNTGKDLGERLAVDPNDGNILYMGTRRDGLWKSTSAAANGSWQRVAGSAIASVVLESIVSNEPEDGSGDGHTDGDIQDAEFGTNDTSFSLRAERSGSGSGRIYTINYTVTDLAGNIAHASVQVVVPHS